MGLTRFHPGFDGHFGEVLRGASVAFAIKVASAAVSFLLSLALARMLGADKTGLYFLSLNVVTIMAVLGKVGMDGVFVRFTSASAAKGDWRGVKGLYRKGMVLSATVSGIAGILLFTAAPWLAGSVFDDPRLESPLRWMSLAVAPFALVVLQGQALTGLKKIKEGVLVSGGLLQGLTLLCALALVPVFDLMGAVASFTLASLLALGAGYFFWCRVTPNQKGVRGFFPTHRMLASSLPLFWVAALQTILRWSSSIMLGIWATSADVGLYAVALRTSNLVSFIMMAVNTISAPKFSEMYVQQDLEELGRLARNTAKLMTLFASPLVLACILIPDQVMSLYGSEFKRGGLVLAILGVGQFVTVVSGSVNFLLTMTGQEKVLRNLTAVSAGICLALNGVLIPPWGMTGAAISMAASVSTLMLLSAWMVWRSLGIVTIPFLPSISTHGKQAGERA